MRTAWKAPPRRVICNRRLNSVMVWLIQLLFCAAVATATIAHPLSRKVEIRNDNGEPVAIDWVHPVTGETVPYGVLETSLQFDSFVNHTFVIRELNSDTPVSKLVVPNDKDTQVYSVRSNLQVERMISTGQNQQATDIVKLCRAISDKQMQVGVAQENIMEDLVRCVEKGTAEALLHQSEELNFQRELRQRIAGLGENYTCADPNLQTTTPKRTTTWTYEGVERDVGILHEHQGSQIHILHEFISEEECQAIEKAAEPGLHRGTVADGKGGSRMSANRKAWQAGIEVVDFESRQDPIAKVKRRLFAYANEAAGYNMELPGQEDIMSIQYFGEGKNNTTPDQYTPHCDGDCDLRPHKTGGRVATMVMYCDVPDLGGATNFQQANVYVKPIKGAAAFFSYMDSETGIHEEGFTTHSGCPVIEGTKRIAVQWMRIGVDEENPWNSFDTNTVSMKQEIK